MRLSSFYFSNPCCILIYPGDCRRGFCDAAPQVSSILGCVRVDDDTGMSISGLELFSVRATSWLVVIL
jgi:hypothetical protein